jgi:hypothetical protein
MTRSDSSARAVIAFIFLFFLSFDIAFTALIVTYPLEILPYSVRAKGFTFFNIVAGLTGIFNQYVNPIALRKIGWRYYVSLYNAYMAHKLVSYPPFQRLYTAAGWSWS